MARREIDTDAILEEATKDDIYNAWLLVCTALIEQEMISFDEIAEMTDSVNRYIKNPPSSEASKEEKTRHAEQLMGICCPYDHINPGNIKSAVELEKFKKKVWKVAIHTSLCVLCLGLEATGKYSPQDLRKIFFGVDITFAEIEHGLTSFSELEKQLAARGVVLERENESDTG